MSEAMAIFAKTKDALPCNRLALTAHDFNALVSGRGSIASFLRVLPSPVESPSPELVKFVPKATLAVDSSRRKGGRSLPEGGASGVGGEKISFFSVGQGEAAAEPDSSSSGGGGSGGECNIGSVWGSDTKRSYPAGGEQEKPPSSPRRPRDTVCPKCGKMLAKEEDLREHLDFHYAEALQERYTREGGAAQGTASVMSDRGGVSKRRRHEMGGKRTKSHTKRPAAERIDAFFKPT